MNRKWGAAWTREWKESREGDERWTEEDGAWMWGLRDACTLHGLRCGAYITLTRGGWQVLGEGRGGRRGGG